MNYIVDINSQIPKGRAIMKKNILKKLSGLFLGLTMGLGIAVGVTAGNKASEVNATDITVISDDVVNNSGYTKYENDDWIITFGGNNKSVGTNSGNRSKCNLSSYAKYAVSPVTQSDVASAFVSKKSLSNRNKITYTFSSGSNQGNTNVYAIYSKDGNTFSQLALTKGTQGHTISSGTSLEFATCSGYFGLLFKATNSSGNWRIDSVGIDLAEGSTNVASLVSISTLSADVSASSGDSSWTISNASATGVLSDSSSVVDVTSYVDFSVTQAVPTIKEDSTTSVTLVATGKSDPKITISTSVTATLSTFNPLKDLYSKSASYSCDVYGIFVGNKDTNNIVIMYGEYGMDIYKSGCGSNSYVAGETILHVSGPLDIYNGLYEIKATSISTSTTESVPTPVVYVTEGGETSLYQSRLTNISGVPTVTKGSITGSAGSADVTLNFKVGTKDVQVFYKKANQTADGMSKMSAAVTNQEVITVTGFTSWYNGFQIQMTDIVEADITYNAEAFAQDLLTATDEVCTGYNGISDNYNSLLTVWNTLIDVDHYQKVPQDQKEVLAGTVANVNGDDVQKAMARYDYLCAKYDLSNFINRTLPLGSRFVTVTSKTNNDSAITAIIAISLVSISTLGVLITIKKRKTITK